MAPTRNAIQLFIGLIVSLLLIGSQLQASDSVDLALDWLQAQANSDGSFQGNDEIVSVEHSTFESIVALANNQRSVTPMSADVVANPEFVDSISISRVITANVLVGKATSIWVTELRGRINYDGGIGANKYGESTVLDTALVLSALQASGSASQAEINKLTSYLLRVQSANGAWRYSDGLPSVALTATVVRSLWLSRGLNSNDVSSAVLKSRQYLLSRINSESGLWSSDVESALVLIALYPTYADPLPLSPFIQRLQQRQMSDGSWSNRVFETALAVQALNSNAADTLVSSLPTIVQGNVVDRDSGVLVSQGEVILESALQSYNATLVNGSYEFSNIDGGIYSLVVNASGYQTKIVPSVQVSPKTTRNLNDIGLAPEPTTAILIGSVLDHKTKMSIVGVEVNVTGADTKTVVTDVNGQFVITDILPGQISIVVNKTGYQVSSASATAKAGQSLLFNPELKPNSVNVSEPLPGTPSKSIVRFLVQDVDGAPVSLAQIKVIHSSNLQTKLLSTGGSGSTQWEVTQEGELSFTISRAGYLPLTAKASVVMGHNLNLAVTIQKEGSEDSGTIADSQDPQENLPTFSELVVRVVDRNSGQPIPNADIRIVGANTLSATTDSNGSFATTDFATEKVTIEVEAQNYLTEGGEVDLYVGNSTLLNVELLAENSIDTRSSTIIGTVVNAEEFSPIVGATVTLTDTTGLVVNSWNSASQSQFELLNVVPGDYQMAVLMNGFYEFNTPIVVNPGMSIDMGELKLVEKLPAPKLIGLVTDFITGEPIEGALVAVSGGSQSATTNEQGHYALNDLTLGDVLVFVSASGYARQSQLLSLETLSTYNLNTALSLVSGIGVSIVETAFAKTELTAYEAVDDVIQLENSTVVDKPVVLEFSLVNSDDEAVLFSKAQDEFGSTVQAPGLIVPAQGLATMTLQWDTLNLTPGKYRAVYRLKTGSEGVGPNSLVLHEIVKTVSIIDTTRILAGTLLSDGGVGMDVGEMYKLAPVVEVQNGSNIPTDLSFSYYVRTQTGQTVANYRWTYGEINPDETSFLIELPEQMVLIPQEGKYFVEVQASVPGQLLILKSEPQLASPSIRLDINQSLSDTEIYPNSEKGITVTIQLEGKEYFGE